MKRIFILRNPVIVLTFAAMLFVNITATAQSTLSVFGVDNVSNTPPLSGPTPFVINNNDNQPSVGIEVGMKFKVKQAGTVDRIYFYKSNGTVGSYTVSIWSNGNSFTPGTRLATATATPAGVVGWTYINLVTPLSLIPGNVYVVSVFNPTGHYNYNTGYFPTTPDDATTYPGFIVIANNEDPALVGNGVYKYTTLSAFPDQSGITANYWVDLRFTTFYTLPVSLTDLKATTNNKDVLVSWKTSFEANNRGFEIQRSNNGTDWYAVSFVKGETESNTVKNYSYTDKSLAPGQYFYRLKQIDVDGKSTNSEVVSAIISGKGAVTLFQNTPNPFNSSTSIRFDLPIAQKVKLSVFDMAGREIKVLAEKRAEAGSHLVTLDAAILQRQTYLVRLQTESGVLVKTILVQ